MNCRRCDWKSMPDEEQSPREQLAEHAKAASHWLCRCCLNSLADEEATNYGCGSCVNLARTLLSGVHTMWTDLPSHLGHLRSPRYDSDRPDASDGRPLPGGDALVLLGPGGSGRSEDHLTHNRKDAPSVAFTLSTWEDDWRHTRGDDAATVSGSSAAVLNASVRYLDTFTRWAAQHHEAFAEYLGELSELHSRLQHATNCHEHVIRSDVECLDCGARLQRQDTATGLADHYVCPRSSCGRSYDTHEFALAATDSQRDRLREHWVTPEQAATILKVPADTVRKWERRGQVRGDRSVSSDGRLMVWYADVEKRRMDREAS